MTPFAPVADQRVLAGSTATLRWQHLDQDGEPADPGTVTVGVTRADGTTVLAAGTATTADGTARTVALTAAQTSTLDLLTATWTRTADSSTYRTLVAVVGGFYFSVTDARASDPTLANDVKYPDGKVQAARAEVEDEFERICDVAFVPRFRRAALDGSGRCTLLLPTPLVRRVTAVAELASDGTSTAWTADEVGDIRPSHTGELHSPRAFPSGRANVVVAWEHGHDRPPDDVRQAALLRLRYRTTRPYSATLDRATSFQEEGGNTYRLDTAGAAKTGIPDVDGVLARWSFAVPGLA